VVSQSQHLNNQYNATSREASKGKTILVAAKDHVITHQITENWQMRSDKCFRATWYYCNNGLQNVVDTCKQNEYSSVSDGKCGVQLQMFLMLSHVGRYARWKWWVLVRMIGFISTLVTTSLNYSQYSDIADLHTLQFTVAHAIGLAVFTSRLVATDLNNETSTSKHYKSSCHFLFNHSATQLHSAELKIELPVAVSYR
jgi:hypothetical protein